MLGWSARVLACQAQVGVSTALLLERRHDVLRGRRENADRIEKALNSGGVSFLNDENGVGVRIFRPRRALPSVSPNPKVKPAGAELVAPNAATHLRAPSKASAR